MKGYVRKPGLVTYSTKGAYIDTIKAIFDRNDEELLSAELYTDALMNGHAYELLTVDEEAKNIDMYRIKPGDGYPVYDDTLKKRMIAFVRIAVIEQDDKDKEPEKERTVYYADQWVRSKWVKVNNSDGQWIEEERKDHPFGDVPAIDYTASMDQKPLFWAVLAFINEHDKITSSSYADERDRYASAYLRMLKRLDNIRRDVNGKTEADNVAERRVFDGLGDDGEVKDVAGAVDFLVKPSNSADRSEMADRFERLIYDLSFVININDYKAGTPAAAIAYRLKVMGMEFKAADIDAYFDKGTQRRFLLIGNASIIHKGTPEPVSIKHDRNIPKDIDSLVVTLGNAKGIVSDKTLLSWIPAEYLPNGVDAELEEILGAIPGLPGDDATGTAGAAEAGDVQATALNGAQISSLVEIASLVASGKLPKESGMAIAKAAFPLMIDSEIEAIFSSIVEGSIKPEPIQPNAFGSKAPIIE
jgi:SPP1 family phage portal protein